MKSSQLHPSIQTLLGGLEQKQDDQVGLKTLTGRAVSRSADSVHMAVRGGIVAVPIANIDEVVPMSKSQPDAVRLVVRNPQAIQPLLRVKAGRMLDGGIGGGIGGGTLGGGGTVEEARDGEKVYTDRTYKVYLGVGTCTYTDTDTTSGGQGQADQCDDSEPDGCPADDEAG